MTEAVKPWQMPAAGDFNKAPLGFQRCLDHAAALSKLIRSNIEKVEYRQLRKDENGVSVKDVFPAELKGPAWDYIDIKMFWSWDGTGIGLSQSPAGDVIFWRWGCAHHYKELSMEECWKKGITHSGIRTEHVYQCAKCGTVNVVDSSD